MAVERKYERDIDIMLAEEFAISPAFASWFCKKAEFTEALEAKVVDVFVSRVDANGESDLVVILQDGSERRFALLIEDKIDAPLQFQQEERYRLRAEALVSAHECDYYKIVLCAPRAYLDAEPRTAKFQASVSYEEISKNWRENDSSARAQYRADFVLNATKRSINLWKKIRDRATDEFWSAAYDIAVREFSILEMRQPDPTMGQTWVVFRPHDLPKRPQRVSVYLKGANGLIDLTFSNTTAYLLHAAIESILPSDVTVHQTGKAAALRIKCDGFQVTDGIEIGLPKVRTAFAAAERLISFYREHRTFLDHAIAGASIVSN